MCEIKWIDDNGKATPDTNDPIGLVWMIAHSVKLTDGRIIKLDDTQKWSICEAHKARMDSDSGMAEIWKFEPMPVEAK